MDFSWDVPLPVTVKITVLEKRPRSKCEISCGHFSVFQRAPQGELQKMIWPLAHPGLLLGDEAICCPSKVSVFWLRFVCVCDSPVGRERIWFQHIYRGMCVCVHIIYIYIYVYMSCIHISMNFTHTPLRFGQLKTKFYKSEWNYEHFAHVEDHFWENLSLK